MPTPTFECKVTNSRGVTKEITLDFKNDRALLDFVEQLMISTALAIAISDEANKPAKEEEPTVIILGYDE